MRELELDCGSFAGSISTFLRQIMDYQLDVFSFRLDSVVEQVACTILDAYDPLPVDEAGTYLVLCATLLRLKSRRLLPLESPLQDDLVRGVEEVGGSFVSHHAALENYREVVGILENLEAESALLCPRGIIPTEPIPKAGGSLQQVSLLTLVVAFEQAMRLHRPSFLEITRPECSLPWAITYTRQALAARGKVPLSRVFPDFCSRLEVVMIFLSILELIRLGEVFLSEGSTEYHLEAKEAFDCLVS